MNQILGTEQNEYLSNRQNAKILYLQQQNKELQDDIEDLQKSLKLNKELLQISYDQQSKLAQQYQNQQQNQNKGNNSTVIASKNNANLEATRVTVDSQNKILIDKIMEENKHLLKQVDKLMKDRNMAQTQVLIAEQISEESQNFQREVLNEQDEKILELRRIIHDKEYAIQEFEKLHPSTLPNGTILKVREILTPNEQCMRLHQEMESLRSMIQKLTSDNTSLTEKNRFLLEYNNNLKREIMKLRVVITNPVSHSKMKETMQSDEIKNVDDNLELHKYFYEQYFKNEEDEDQARDYIGEQKYQDYLLRQQEYIKNQGPQQQNPSDFIQSRQQLFDKIDALEYTINNYKKIFAREVENNKVLQENITQLQRHNKEILTYNDILIQSNKQHQEKCQQQHREVELYKSYYFKYLEFMKNRRKHNQSQANSIPINIKDLMQGYDQINKGNLQKPQQNTSKVQKPSSQLEINQQSEQQHLEKQNFKKNKNTDKQNTEDSQQIQDNKSNNNENEEKAQENIEVNVSILDDDDEEDIRDTNILQNNNNLNNQNILQNLNQEDFNTNKNKNTKLTKKQRDINEMESYHEQNLQQSKQYLLNMAKDLYINLSNNNNSKGITRQVLKKIQLGNGKPGNVLLFKNKRSLSNPLDYTSKEFLEQITQIKVRKYDDKDLLNTNIQHQNQNTNFYGNIQFQQNNNQQQQYINEQEYQRTQQMVTQQCNFDFDEQRQMNSNMIVIKKNQNNPEFQFQTQMNQGGDILHTQNFNNEHYNKMFSTNQNQNQQVYTQNNSYINKSNNTNNQTQQQQKIKVNIGVPFDSNFEKIEGQPVHKKKITLHQFNNSFFSNDGEDLDF